MRRLIATFYGDTGGHKIGSNNAYLGRYWVYPVGGATTAAPPIRVRSQHEHVRFDVPSSDRKRRATAVRLAF